MKHLLAIIVCVCMYLLIVHWWFKGKLVCKMSSVFCIVLFYIFETMFVITLKAGVCRISRQLALACFGLIK